MDFLGIGPLEFVFIIIIMIIVFGPKDLVATGKKMGDTIRKVTNSDILKQMLKARDNLSQLSDTIAEETGLREVQRVASMSKSAIAKQDLSAWIDTPKSPIAQSAPAKSEEKPVADETAPALPAWTSASQDAPEAVDPERSIAPPHTEEESVE